MERKSRLRTYALPRNTTSPNLQRMTFLLPRGKKLAVYKEGGHFGWHIDTTHSNEHHATLLLALNTTWEGGDLKLRHNGVEAVVDMHPKADRHGEGINLQAVAFYTDTEHKVEPVTKGVRIVLQYDAEVVGWGEKQMERREDDEAEVFDCMESMSKKRKRCEKSSDSPTADNAAIKQVEKRKLPSRCSICIGRAQSCLNS
jgi:predicted 2-oxoglutarate/Fe(II)-dependent dioxygenase YbiX